MFSYYTSCIYGSCKSSPPQKSRTSSGFAFMHLSELTVLNSEGAVNTFAIKTLRVEGRNAGGVNHNQVRTSDIMGGGRGG